MDRSRCILRFVLTVVHTYFCKNKSYVITIICISSSLHAIGKVNPATLNARIAHTHTRTPPKRFHRFTLFVECTLHVRRCYRCRHCQHRRRHFSGCSSRFSYSIASNPFSFSLRKVGVKMHISARARSIDRMHIMTLINRDRVCEVSFFGYVHHRRECITFNIRLSVYSRRIVFVQKVCGINVEMSSAAAAAVAVNFSFSLFGTSNFLCGFWHILCRARWRKIVSSKHSMQLMYDVGDDDDDDWYTSRVDTCTIILLRIVCIFHNFAVGWVELWVNVCVIKICLVLFGFLPKRGEIHAFHTNLTRSKLENNGKSFFSGAHILQRRWVMLP